MKWVIITGTWRLTNKEVENDVREAVRQVFKRGDGMVTGGATGVDYFAMDESVKLNPDCIHIKIFIPALLDHFISDYRKNWMHYPINETDIDKLEDILRLIKSRNPDSIVEARKDSGDISQADYTARHMEEINFSDEVYAFKVNNSTGTSDTINKARIAGLPIGLYKNYTIKE